MISFFFENTKPPLLKRAVIKNYINTLIAMEGFNTGDISIIFCDDDYLLQINRQYLNHDYLTDIITFDYSENSIISGDLFISVDRVIENAEIFKNSFITELYRVIFHGVLHLSGYDDKNEESKMKMREKENLYLGIFNLKEIQDVS